MTRKRGLAASVVAIVLGMAAILIVIRRSETLPTGPVDVVWNHTLCAECRMSVGERAYAAQLQTRDGRVLDFDDPGCLFRYEDDNPVEVHAVYFHHVREDRWLAEAEAGFVFSGPSPMGYDLGAVTAGDTGALSPERAREKVLHPAGDPARRNDDAH
ncbi:MAG TPA: hypothetical protein PLQ13_09925 [Candidatus Krumholzibacteria bacterium]|nr:hypothetical protein [Candidatus Krumholzibacteria bacterium]